jgi:hypothetical protein
MARLFDGAYRAVCWEIGHAPPDAAEGDELVAEFRAWAKAIDRDPDLGADARMMVPVFFDQQRKLTKVWVFLGWERTPLRISYEAPPAVVSCEREDGGSGDAGRVRVTFQTATCQAATPAFAEVYVSRLLDRDEFRRHCDRYATPDAILSNLS